LRKGKGKFLAQSAIEAIEMAYERGETDEFVQSSVIKSPTKINLLAFNIQPNHLSIQRRSFLASCHKLRHLAMESVCGLLLRRSRMKISKAFRVVVLYPRNLFA
jgi:hypothetical protein